jgi:predicted ArsR family transcriptional regulator
MSEAEQREDGWHVQFIVYNCPFKEILDDKADITCKIHTAFLNGTLQVLFDDVQLHQKTTMLEGCHDCTYHAIVTN